MEHIMHLLWTISWQTAIVAGIVWLVCRVAGKAPASWKCALWVVVLVKFLVPPFAYLPANLAFWQHPTPLAESHMPVADAPTPSVPAAMDADRPAPRTVTAPASAEPAAPVSIPSPMDLLAMVWALGMCAMVVRLVVLHRRQAALVRESLPADDGLREMLWDAASRLSVRRLPDVRLSESIPTPVLVGLIRPVILLPFGIGESCGASDLHAMLMHELAHVRRRDVALSWFHQVVQAIFFFHPATWLAGRELRVHRELACDELVLSTPGVDRHEYAEGYLSALKLANGQPTRTMALAMAEPFEIEKRRLAMIVNGTTRRMSRRWLVLLAAVVVVGIPTFAGVTATRNTQKDSCKANMRSLGKMLMRYAAHNGGWLPAREGQEWVLEARKYLTSIPVLFCPGDQSARADWMATARETEVDPYQADILDELHRKNLTLTDYELPQMTGGMKVQDLPKDAVLLQERGPGHNGKLLRLHVDLTFSEADAPASEAASAPARSAKPTGVRSADEPRQPDGCATAGRTHSADEFSSDFSLNLGNSTKMTGRIYYADGEKMRQEIGSPVTSVHINRPDKRISWVLTPGVRSYAKAGLREGDRLPTSWAMGPAEVAKWPGVRKVGTEKCNGLVCDKYQVKHAGGGMTFWFARHVPIPIRMVRDTMTLDLKNVKREPQPASLFEIPKGYREESGAAYFHRVFAPIRDDQKARQSIETERAIRSSMAAHRKAR